MGRWSRWWSRPRCYQRLADASEPYLCEHLADDTLLLTAAGGMGLTAGPAIAVEVLDNSVSDRGRQEFAAEVADFWLRAMSAEPPAALR
jgi:hypothetical protein